MLAAQTPRHITEGIRAVNGIVDEERRRLARVGVNQRRKLTTFQRPILSTFEGR